MKKTIATLALGLGLLATGCASNLPRTPTQEREYTTRTEAAEVLNIPQSEVCNIPGGYKTSQLGMMYLEQAAMAYAEMNGLIDNEKGITISEDVFAINPLLLNIVAKNADTHRGDKIITDEEAKDYALNIDRESLKSRWGFKK